MSKGPDPVHDVDLHALNLYARLGVRQGATEDEIRAAYKRLVKQIHPDLNGERDEDYMAYFDGMMRAANEAHDTLLDPRKRVLYDQRRGFDQSRSSSSGLNEQGQARSRSHSAKHRRGTKRKPHSQRSATGATASGYRREGAPELVRRALGRLLGLSGWHRRGS